MIKIEPTSISGSYIFHHDVYPDNRGIFREWFRESIFNSLGLEFRIAQANFSNSRPGVIRGLHYSLAPSGQSKLVTCVQGNVRDCLVDIRCGSPTYLEKVYLNLDSSSGNSLFIPNGVAHGFSVLAENSSIAYLTSSEYSATYEKSINPEDKVLEIDWEIDYEKRIMSESDSKAISFETAIKLNLLPDFSETGR